MQIKMIATDLDGTLLRGSDVFSAYASDYSLDVLKRCRAEGVKVVYATGRDDGAKVPAISEIVDGYASNNGARAYIGCELVYERTFSTESVRGLLVAADGAGIKIAIVSGGVFYGNFNDPQSWNWQWPSACENSDFNTFEADADFLFAYVNSTEESATAKRIIIERLPKELRLSVREDGFLFIVLHNEATKSRGVAALAERWGIMPSEIAAFGNDMIDVDLLEYCGVGVAVSNATDDLKRVADFICGSNENDGVAKWIEEHILKTITDK